MLTLKNILSAVIPIATSIQNFQNDFQYVVWIIFKIIFLATNVLSHTYTYNFLITFSIGSSKHD